MAYKMSITIMVDQDYSHIRDERLKLNDLADKLRNDVEEHLKGMGHECPEPRCYIMTDSDSDL
jgi:hypothetical protein